MKKQNKITLSAILAALSCAFMIFSRIPNLTYAVPALSGLFIMIILFEAGVKYAVLAFLVSALLNFVFADINSCVLFVLLFGYYPIIKAVLDSKANKTVGWVFKILLFNFAAAGCFFVFKFIIGFELSSLYIWGKYTIVLSAILLNAVFVLYDIALSQAAEFYFARIRHKMDKYLK